MPPSWVSVPLNASVDFNGVWGFAPNDVWAVGDSGTIQHWDGFTWSNVPSGTGQQLNGVFGFASNDVWAVGNLGTIRHWDGATWSASVSGTSDQLNCVFGVAANDVWVGRSVSGTNDSFLHWNGSSWSTVTGPTTNIGASAIWGASSTDVWTATKFNAEVWHWNGTAWSVFTTLGNRCSGIFGFAANDIWMNSDQSGVGGSGVYHWNGSSWTFTDASTTFSPTTTVQFRSVWGDAPNDVWVVGNGGTAAHWDGAAWTTMPNIHGSLSDQFLSVWGVATDDVWTLGFTAVGNDAMHWTLGTALGSLPKAISGSGQAQLTDGSCLVFGGIDGTDFKNESIVDSYLISPDGQTFKQVGNIPFLLGDPRTALLGDGRVLMVSFGQAATFDPTTLVWTLRASSSLANANGALVSLPNGNALLIDGGLSHGVQEYISATNLWANRASTILPHNYISATTLTATNEVFIDSFEGTSFSNGRPEVYDIMSDTWSLPANLPQSQNHCQTQVILPTGKLFTCSSGTGFALFADLYDPETKLFTPLAGLPGSNHTQTVNVYPPNGFLLGENLVAVLSTSSPPRTAWYNYSLNKWSGGGFDNNPDYQTNGESLESPSNRFYLGQAGGTLGFLVLGHNTQSTGYYLPHAAGFYVERSQKPVFDGHLPTFNGIVTVEQGLTADRVFLTWNDGSDATTNIRDLTYYAYATQISGGENYGNPNNQTFIWAGSLSTELRNLTPAILHYFQVAVRNMRGKNQPDEYLNDGNPQTTSVEATFTPNTPGVPLSSGNWVSAPDLDRPRSGPAGAYLSEGRYLVWGGFDSGNPGQGAPFGNIYSQDARSMLVEFNAPTFVEGAVVDASPRIYGQPFALLGYHKATATGGLESDLSGTVPFTSKYFPYTDFWNQPEGFFSTPGNMNESVYRHAMVQMPYGSLLRIGGMTTMGNVNSTTNTVEYFHYGTPTISYTSLVTPFTVGAVVAGTNSGARGKILSDSSGVLALEPYSDLQFVVGEIIQDTSGGKATGLFSNILYDQSWSFRTSMTFNRSQHSAINLNGYSMRLATVTGAFSVGEVITGASSGATAEVTFAVNDLTNGFSAIELSNFDPTDPFTLGEHITGNMTGDGFLNGFDIFKSTKVLVVGGKDETGAPSPFAAELYDFFADTWTYVGPTTAAHYLFPLVMGSNGQPVAISGGTTVVESYDSDTNTWNVLAPFSAAKTEHTAHVFGSGKIGVFGGRSAGFLNTDVLMSTWGTSKDDVWVVGFDLLDTYGVIYHWNGLGWSRQTFNLGPVTRFHSVFGFATNNVWVVGQSGYSMHWDGVTWTDVSTGAGFTLNSVFGVASGELWAVGIAGRIYKWNGSSWVSQTSPTSEDLLDISGWHVGATYRYIAVGANGTIIQSTDTTPAWTIIHAGLTTAYLRGITYINTPSQAWWICGDDQTLTATGPTGSFSVFSHGMGTDFFWEKVRGAATNDVWMVGFSFTGDIGVVARFNGSSWTATHPGFGMTTFRGLMAFPISGPPSRFVWAVGNQQDMAFNQPAIVWNYNGTTWSADYLGGETAGVVATVLLYDPVTDVWSTKQSMIDARARHVSFLMPNNKVLVAGGEDNVGTSLISAEKSPGPA